MLHRSLALCLNMAIRAVLKSTVKFEVGDLANTSVAGYVSPKVACLLALAFWVTLSDSGISGHTVEKSEMTDLPIESLLLDAAYAPLAATFYPPAAMLVANDRGSAQPGLSPVVLPPPPHGFVLGGNGPLLGRCPGCSQSSGWICLGALSLYLWSFCV